MATIAISIRKIISEIIALTDGGINMTFGIEGAPGLAKTACGPAVAEHYGIPHHLLIPAQRDTYEWIGLPVPQHETKQVEWYSPDDIPTEKCVLTIDEVGQCPQHITTILLELFLERRIGNVRLHPETIIIYTTNRVEDNADCRELPTALKERAIRYTVKADTNVWLDWFYQSDDYNEAVYQYVASNPDLLHVFNPNGDTNQPSPRSWHRVAKVLPHTQTLATIAGIIGEKHARPFLKFAKQHRSMPSVASVIDGKSKMPDNPLDAKAFATAVVRFADQCTTKKRHKQIVKLLKEMPVNWAVIALRQMGETTNVIDQFENEYRPIVRKYAEAINSMD